jgi:tetratricopeptide (TPR) repeat protein
LSLADMLIGADFFLSHRIYVASSQHKLYFTYNGGPVFNLTSSSPTAAAPRGGSSVPEDADAPTDAAGFARRGAAFAARRDFEHAIADFTRATELQPEEPEYLRQRGKARAQSGQRQLAMADVDRALELKPDDVGTLILRAELRLANHEEGSADADLDTVERIAPKEADIRAQLGALNTQAGRYSLAVAEFTQWIAAHRADARMAQALNERCWARALWGHELDEAIADCNAALRRQPKSASFLDSRGLAEFRVGQLDRAIADWDAALTIEPKQAWTLYIRGVAKIHQGKKTDGQTDIAAATALAPKIIELGRRRGLAPDAP